MKIISVRVTDEEKEMLEKAKKMYNCGISTLFKKITFEKLENDFDLKIIEKYEKSKKEDTLELMPIDEVWERLEI